jgi:hypothetical protein
MTSKSSSSPSAQPSSASTTSKPSSNPSLQPSLAPQDQIGQRSWPFRPRIQIKVQPKVPRSTLLTSIIIRLKPSWIKSIQPCLECSLKAYLHFGGAFKSKSSQNISVDPKRGTRALINIQVEPWRSRELTQSSSSSSSMPWDVSVISAPQLTQSSRSSSSSSDEALPSMSTQSGLLTKDYLHPTRSIILKSICST